MDGKLSRQLLLTEDLDFHPNPKRAIISSSMLFCLSLYSTHYWRAKTILDKICVISPPNEKFYVEKH